MLTSIDKEIKVYYINCY